MNGTIAASTVFNHQYYWSTLPQIEENDLYVIDKIGIESLKESYHGQRKLIVIYIETDPEECIFRMRKRGDNNLAILDRVQHDFHAFEGIEELSDFIIDGDRAIYEVADQLYDIIQYCESESE